MTDSMFGEGCSSCRYSNVKTFQPSGLYGCLKTKRCFTEGEYNRINSDDKYRVADCPLSVENAEESSAPKPTEKKENPSKLEELNKNIVELNKNLDLCIQYLEDLLMTIKQRF